MKIKRLKVYIPIFLSLCLGFSSCSNIKTNEESKTPLEVIEETIEQVFPSLAKDDEKEEIDELTQSYINKLNDINITYNHEEYYLTNEYVDNLLIENNTLVDCTYSGLTDSKSVAEQIESNSQGSTFFDEQTRKTLINILDKLLITSNSNKLEDIHKISTIKILNGRDTTECDFNEVYLAYFDEDTNTIYINDRKIKEVSMQEVVSYNYLLSYILEHELNHVRQTICPCNNITQTRLTYNEYASFIIESTAETSLYQEQTSKRNINYNYDKERVYQSEILLLSLFKNDDMTNFYKSIYDNNLSLYYDYLDLEDDEVYDYYKIVYNMDALLNRNTLVDDIYDNPEELYMHDVEMEIGITYKETLFKLFLNRYMKYLSNNNMKIDDCLSLYYLVKNIVMTDCYSYDDTADHLVKDFPESTIDSIYQMDQVFISYLSSKYNLTEEELREKEDLEGLIGAYQTKEYINTLDNQYYTSQVKRILNEFPMLYKILENNDYINLNSYKESLENNKIYIYK